jgi:hypothetical protein
MSRKIDNNIISQINLCPKCKQVLISDVPFYQVNLLCDKCRENYNDREYLTRFYKLIKKYPVVGKHILAIIVELT